MKNDIIIKQRKEFRELIIGTWISDEFIDNELKEKYTITFTIDNKFKVTEEPISLEAKKTLIKNNTTENISIIFLWTDVYLTSSYKYLLGGFIAINPEKNEIGFYRTRYHTPSELTEKNLILRFRKK